MVSYVRKHPLLGRAYEAWESWDDSELKQNIRDGKDVDEIAASTQRSALAIVSRAELLK